MQTETLKLLESPGWMTKSACASDPDPDAWYCGYSHYGDDPLENQRRTQHAIDVCEKCPVIAQCLRWAFDVDDQWAVLGGKTPNQRKRSRLKIQQALIDDLYRPAYRSDHRRHDLKKSK